MEKKGKAKNKQIDKRGTKVFGIGEQVRVVKNKGIFDKLDRKTFNKNIYNIVKEKGRGYIIKNQKGTELFKKPTEVIWNSNELIPKSIELIQNQMN